MKCGLVFSLLFFGLASSELLGQSPTPSPVEINPTGNAGALKPQVRTGGSYDAHSGNATRIVTDLHVPGALGTYGLDFTRYWNSNHNDYDDSEMEWPTDFGGSGWSHSWRWTAAYEYRYPATVLASCGEDANMVCESDDNQYTTAINISFPDGHTTQYKIVRLGYGEWSAPGSYPVFGPPYTQPEINFSWPNGGAGVHDHLCNMAVDGSRFWLCRADGGSVRFVKDATHGFQAREVYDPNGLRTDLTYTEDRLTHVQQEGGRFLEITWNYFSGGAWLITHVQSGTSSAPSVFLQTATYLYSQLEGSWTLQHVVYENEQLTATYTYGTCYGDGPEPCTGSAKAPLPLLKRADDPHYEGPMTTIRYNYRGAQCPPHLVRPWEWPAYVPAQVYAVAEEKSDTGLIVSKFTIECDSGQRKEENGLGGWRIFYFSNSAGTSEPKPGGGLLRCAGYQLGKLTDFTGAGGLPPNLPNERQNFTGGEPYHIWDGRGNRTEVIPLEQDDSGEPAEIHRADGSVELYDRINPGASSPIDPSQGMHNPYNHWVFKETHQINATASSMTIYRRDSRRRVTQIDYPDGTHEYFGYNNFNQVTSHTLPSGAVVTSIYDGRGLLQTEHNSIDGWDARKEYVYDGLDRAWKVSDARSRSEGKDFSTRMTYNGRHQILTVEYGGMDNASDNATVRYGYDPKGNCIWITDELNHTRSYEYDGYRRCISYTEPLGAPNWDGSATQNSRRWDWMYDRWIDGGIGGRDQSSHTANEWRIQIEPPFNSACERRMTARWHDVNNRVLAEHTGWVQPCNLPLYSWYPTNDIEIHYFTYDENGQKKSYTDPLNRLTTYEYDNRNRLTKTNETVNTIPRTTETLYDFAGNKTRVNFPLEAAGQRSQQWLDYDAFGQPGRFVDERGNTTKLTYQWGPMKKLLTVTTRRDKDGSGMEDQVTTFTSNGMGRPIKTLFPDNSYEAMTYECKQGVSYLCEQAHTWRTRKGQLKTITYDARGREIWHTWSDDTPGINRTWDAASRMTTISNQFSTIDYKYDDAGQVWWEGSTVAGSGGRGQTSYNRYADGAMSYRQAPGGTWVHHEYTARGQLKSVSDRLSGAWRPTLTYFYHQDGKVEHQEYGNGVRTDFNYDGRGMLSSLHHHRASPYQNYAWRQYSRDERDRITSFQKGCDNTVNPMENGRGDHFWYDAEGELTDAYYEALDPASNPNNQGRQDHFVYDQMGNRKGSNLLASRGWMGFTRDDNGLNQYGAWGSSAVQHDDDIGPPWGTLCNANGVLMFEGTTLAGYNALNQPMYINSPGAGWISFGYDPLGRCVKRWAGLSSDPATNPATYFYYDGWNLIQEGQSAATVSRYYVHGAGVDEIVESSNATGQYAYHHYDARGHCILLTNTSGGILEQYDYDAFGLPHFYNAAATYSPTSAFGNRFLFTGREWLGELHIYDYRNRLYQPELGRFMQPDPKEFDAGDYNLYRYCHNDPINKNDPWGLEPVKILLDKSGNWGDKGSGDYYNEKVTANNKPAEGVTKAELQRLTPNPDGSVSGSLFVDTHVKSIHKDGKVDNKEQEHPNGWKDFARTLQDKVFLKFKDQTHSSPIEAAKAQAEYVQKLFKEEKRTQTIWDRPGGPHDYSRPENR